MVVLPLYFAQTMVTTIDSIESGGKGISSSSTPGKLSFVAALHFSDAKIFVDEAVVNFMTPTGHTFTLALIVS